MRILLLFVATASSYPHQFQPSQTYGDSYDYLEEPQSLVEGAHVLPLIELQGDYKDIAPFYKDVLDDYVIREKLPWYTDMGGNDDEAKWMESIEKPVQNQETLLDIVNVDEEDESPDVQLEREKNRKRSEKIIQYYNLSKNPFISTRKASKSSEQTNNQDKKSIIPKKHENASAKPEMLFSAEKRGMPEVPIYRPANSADPVKQRRSSTGTDLSVRGRYKRSIDAPVPFFSSSLLQPSDNLKSYA